MVVDRAQHCGLRGRPEPCLHAHDYTRAAMIIF
jgi:hypothetical protein